MPLLDRSDSACASGATPLKYVRTISRTNADAVGLTCALQMPTAREPQTAQRQVAQVPAQQRPTDAGSSALALLRLHVRTALQCVCPSHDTALLSPPERGQSHARVARVLGLSSVSQLVLHVSSLVVPIIATVSSLNRKRHNALTHSLTLCVTVHSPVDPTASQLHRIVACPASVAHFPQYNLCMRMIHSSATVTTLLALYTIAAAHSVNDLKTRERHATLLTFARPEPVHKASAAIEL